MNYNIVNFDDEISKYLESLDLKEITKRSYEKILTTFARYLKVRFILLPSKKDILDYKDYLAKSVRSASIQKTIVVLRGFFTYLDSEGMYKNIMIGIKGAKIEPTFKREAFSLTDLKRIVDLAKSKSDSLIGLRNYAIILLMVTTGLRTIEIERASISDLSSIKGRRLLYVQGKGSDDKDNYVKLSSEVFSVITDYLIKRNDELEPLFITHGTNHLNKRIQTRTIRGLVKEYLRQIGIDDKRYTAHSLRHSVATNLIKYGNVTLEEAKQVLRHKDIKTTQIYNHAVIRSENEGELIMSKLILESDGDIDE
ncbi:MAG: tyrosine-type recombinase/integrase [Acholeplasmataceae bacterium]|nr:tyrosine-type recombinase/integrase [Acholeplasmataceae bacterium]